MKTLLLLATVFTVSAVSAWALEGDEIDPAVWHSVNYAARGRHNRHVLWFRDDGVLTGGARQLYRRPCGEDVDACAPFLTAHTLTPGSDAGQASYVNINGDPGDRRLATPGRNDAADIARFAAGGDERSVVDAAAVEGALAGAEGALEDHDGGLSTLDAEDGEGEGEGGAEEPRGDGVGEDVTGSPVVDTQPGLVINDIPSPPPVEVRGLALPDRIAAGAGLGLLGAIAAFALTASPLGAGLALLALGGAGYGLASVFGHHNR